MLYISLRLTNIIALSILLLSLQSCQKNNIENYFDNPQIGDIYLIKHTFENDTSYSYLRLASFSPKKDSFTFFRNKKTYNQLPSTLDKNDFFIARNRNFSLEEILLFFKENPIISIRRSKENTEDFCKIKPLEDKELKFHLYPPYPKSKTWKILTSLQFDIQFDENIGDVVFKPLFTQPIKNLDGKFITINAYMYAKNEENNTIILSYRPVDLRTVCSAFGAESLVVIKNNPSLIFQHEKPCLIKARLKLSNSDYTKLPYQLSDVEFIECIE